MINVSPFEVFLRYVIFFLCWSGKTQEHILENKMYMSINSRKIKQIQKKRKKMITSFCIFEFWKVEQNISDFVVLTSLLISR